MRETAGFLKQYAIEALDVARLQWKPFVIGFALLFGVYAGSLFIPAGIVTYLLVVPPALICALTSLARVNDIGVEKMSLRWQVRRIGLVMAGAGSVMILAAPFTGYGPVSWRGVLLVWGVGLTWLTTPEMPPWSEYITGEYRNRPPPRSPISRIVGRVTGSHRTAALREAEDRNRRGDGAGP